MMSGRTKTKIIATLGPASDTYARIREMTLEGMSVARLNFSHGTHSEHLRRMEIVRKVNKKYKRCICIMQDLEGLRIRIGRFRGKTSKILRKRQVIWLIRGDDTAGISDIPFDYRGELSGIGAGQYVYIDDGNIILRVKKSFKDKIKAEVIEGGVLKERKGVNIPGVRIPFSGVTRKDRADILFGIHHRMDYIAQSFVRSKKDIEKVRRLVKPSLPRCGIVAKIESREAIKNIDGIIGAADMIMIARGDMGIAVPIYEVPLIQKSIIRKCNMRKKPVITATQMLEHMTEHSRPTRAEVTDVANAILDGTDFVMLSAETASGKFPVKSVRMMKQIARFTETGRHALGYGRK